jgi:hypothetical protein
MLQLVIGSTIGYLLAQVVLVSARFLLSRLQGPASTGRLRRFLTPGPKAVSMFVRYAAPVAGAAALITLGIWTVSDYLAAKSARGVAMANTFDTVAPVTASQPRAVADENISHAPELAAAAEPAAGTVDPYEDPEFKVQHHGHRGNGAALKEVLLQKSEVKASADLRRETQQHLARSQYDCEAADRAERYLKAGLDVWGFAAWQQRYFPTDGYKGATLEQCREIKTLLPGSLDLQSTVAQQTR